jgi:predicted RNase H-like HicB family nuclease
MSKVKLYEYDITQEDGLWVIHIPELDLVTQAEHLRDTDRMATSIISLHLNVSAKTILVRRSNIIGLPKGAAEAVLEAVEARGRWNAAQEVATEVTLKAVHRLRDSGISLRDTGYLLGLSHQRVAQLLDGEKTPSKTSRTREVKT